MKPQKSCHCLHEVGWKCVGLCSRVQAYHSSACIKLKNSQALPFPVRCKGPQPTDSHPALFVQAATAATAVTSAATAAKVPSLVQNTND